MRSRVRTLEDIHNFKIGLKIQELDNEKGNPFVFSLKNVQKSFFCTVISLKVYLYLKHFKRSKRQSSGRTDENLSENMHMG